MGKVSTKPRVVKAVEVTGQVLAPVALPKPMGRPSLYSPDLCDRIVSYFRERCHKAMSLTGDPTYNALDTAAGASHTHVRKIYSECPTLEGFADSINVSVNTLCRWRDQYSDFHEAIARARDLWAHTLGNLALAGAVNHHAAIWVGSNTTNWRAKQEITGEGGTPLNAAPVRMPVRADMTVEEMRRARALLQEAAAICAPKEEAGE
jgi:hypothetical protein